MAQSVSFDFMGWSVEQTPVKLLASLSHLAPLMDALTDNAIRYLLHSEKFGKKMEALPMSALVHIANNNTRILTSVPRGDFPGRALMNRLSKDKSFLQQLLINKLVVVAKSDFRYILDDDSIVAILEVHPNAPSLIGEDSKEVLGPFLLKQSVLDRLSPEAVAGVMAVLHYLDAETTAAVLRNAHVRRHADAASVEAALARQDVARLLGQDEVDQINKDIQSKKDDK